MRGLLRLPVTVFAVMLFLPACASRVPVGLGKQSEFERSLNALSVPLDLQDYRVVSAEGHHGIFLKLSRLPDAIVDRAEENPPRIVLDIKGPTGTEAPEQDFPGGDTLVSHVRVARAFGNLQVVLDLQGNEVPPYSVHRMADWVMVRLGQ